MSRRAVRVDAAPKMVRSAHVSVGFKGVTVTCAPIRLLRFDGGVRIFDFNAVAGDRFFHIYANALRSRPGPNVHV